MHASGMRLSYQDQSNYNYMVFGRFRTPPLQGLIPCGAAPSVD